MFRSIVFVLIRPREPMEYIFAEKNLRPKPKNNSISFEFFCKMKMMLFKDLESANLV
jgi:hypothetical protein